MFLKDLNLDKKDTVYLFFLIIFSLLIIYELINFHLSGGIFSPDKGAYLSNALNFANLDIYHISDPEEFFLSPTISFLTSLLFRLGFVNYSSILVVTGILGLFGIIGFYILLKYQFNSLMSLMGSMLMLSFSVIILNLASGLLDFPSISISIWIIIFTILAVNKNPKYHVCIFPLFIIGFFTRYTVGFMLPIIILYYLINKDIFKKIDVILINNTLKSELINYIKSDEFKYILVSIILGTFLFLLYCKSILDFGSTLGFIQQSQGSIVGNKMNPLSVDFSDDVLFYLKNFSEILFNETRIFDSTLTYGLYSIIGLGLIIKMFDIKNNNRYIIKQNFKTRYLKIILKFLFILSIIGIIYGIILQKQIIINICLLLFFIVVSNFVQKFNFSKESFAFIILNLVWFLIYLVYFSYYPIKTYRYIMPLIPPFIYFIIYFLNYILFYKLKGLKFSEKYLNLIPILFIIILILSTVNGIDQMQIPEKANDLKEVCEYIIDYDGDYHSKIIFSYDTHHRIARWYLNTPIIPFSDEGIKSLNDINADYIISEKKLDLKNFDIIHKKGEIYLYELS